jgi:hypothetical protein
LSIWAVSACDNGNLLWRISGEQVFIGIIMRMGCHYMFGRAFFCTPLTHTIVFIGLACHNRVVNNTTMALAQSHVPEITIGESGGDG